MLVSVYKIIVLGAIEPEIQAFYSCGSSRFGQNSTTCILRPGRTKKHNLFLNNYFMSNSIGEKKLNQIGVGDCFHFVDLAWNDPIDEQSTP